MEIFNLVVLALSGMLLCYAGLNRLVKPISSLCLTGYAKNSDIELKHKSDIYNEMRSAGAQLFLSGIIILLGIFIPTVEFWSFVIATITFLGYAFGRIVSLKVDGKVCKELMSGLYSEIILGVLNFICMMIILFSV